MLDQAIQPICFMIMPFGKKSTGIQSPAIVDFDALWSKAIKPALIALGYRPVRADQDTDSLIIHQMLERLYYSDVVIADISIANANVYYEVGIRHAARSEGCVLIAADWSLPVFDLAQVRHLRYPLADGAITDECASKIQESIVNSFNKDGAGASPMSQAINGYPNPAADQRRAQELAGQLEFFENLSGEMQAILKQPPESRHTDATALVQNYAKGFYLEMHTLTSMMIKFIRDAFDEKENKNWQELINYINKLPANIRKFAFVQEQFALAKAKQGEFEESIRLLEGIIKQYGETFERRGLIGGRCKQLYAAETKRLEQGKANSDTETINSAKKNARLWLNQAIENYELGMFLDLNEFYCSCNLPALYRDRDDDEDEDKAVLAAALARTACERKLQRGEGDEWTVPTLISLAFAEKSLPAAKSAWKIVKHSRRAEWMQNTSKATVQKLLSQIPDSNQYKEKFIELYDEIFS